MAKEFKFPDIGEGITEGEIVKWLVKEDDSIEEDQTLAEVETDKAVVEVPSPYAGTVLKLHFQEKDIVKVGQTLVTIGESGESLDEAMPDPATPKPSEPEKPAPTVVGQLKVTSQEIRDILATPKVRRAALQLGIDIKTVSGSGPGGRITEEDVQRVATASQAPEDTRKPAFKVKSKYDFYGTLNRIPLRGVRRATARKMAESIANAAHVTHFDEADVTALAALRKEMKPEAEARGVKLTYLPFVIKAVVESLKLHPTLNASLDMEEQEIIVKEYYNIGVAVDVPDGLIVPVIKFADQKTLFELSEEIVTLAEAAKKRTLDLADLKGGTFSLTNVGMLGGEFATPIINYPEAAILATLKIADRPRVIDGEIKIAKTLPLCLSFDHRVIDGAEAARFTNDLIGLLENPQKLVDISPGEEE
jgi:pyruvate dehydrogenase E2 component (dihydrolipoamide acetyltransferase)